MISPDIDTAVNCLRRGLTVVFPTETVYGLGADAADPEAVERVFALKGRPRNRPLIVHVESASRLEEWTEKLPWAARRLAERFWPGPLTLVLPRRKEVLAEVAGGSDFVGVRVPDHPVALSLLKAFGRGVAAPSANRFGRLSPTSSWHVRMEFGDEAGPILEGGPCRIGLESTILGFFGKVPTLLRPGSISPGVLEEFLGARILRTEPEGDRFPGSGGVHYAPNVPLEVLPAADLLNLILCLADRREKVGVLALSSGWEGLAREGVARFVMPGTPSEYGRELYSALHFLDRSVYGRILVEAPPEGDAWSAVNDRLRRASLRTTRG